MDLIVEEPERDRFGRFKLISWWEQEKLQKARLLVIGAGALGNEILKNLAMLGVGNIFIVDLDAIENSNLSRSILFRERDNGAGKAETAARAVQDIYPDINIQFLQGNAICDLGLGVYAWADLVIAGLDNRAARLYTNRNCWKVSVPWIDGAIEQLSGVARVFIPPHGACYECTLGEADWQILRARKACNLLSRDEMLAGKIPTTPTSASIIAGIQCQEAVKLLHGLEVLESKGYIFDGLSHNSYVIKYPRNEECGSHETYSNIHSLGLGVGDTTPRRLLRSIRKELGEKAEIDLNFDILQSLSCSKCGAMETFFRPVEKVAEREGFCSKCSMERESLTFHKICGEEQFLDRTFAEIGLPPFDIIKGRNGPNELYFKFDGDARKVLGPLYGSYIS